jgi:2-haloacid dehalogenase
MSYSTFLLDLDHTLFDTDASEVAVFKSLDSPPKETAVMVGDNLSADIRGGVNYGIATCWYNPHGRPHDGLHQGDHEVSDLMQLTTLLAD